MADLTRDDVIRLVQVSDFKVGTIASSQRLVPGDGDIPLSKRFEALAGAGYAGAFEIEMVGPRIESEGYESAIRRAVARTGRLLAGEPGLEDGREPPE